MGERSIYGKGIERFALNVATGELLEFSPTRSGRMPLVERQSHPSLANKEWNLVVMEDGRLWGFPYLPVSTKIESDDGRYGLIRWYTLLPDNGGEVVIATHDAEKERMQLFWRPDEATEWAPLLAEPLFSVAPFFYQLSPDSRTLYLLLTEAAQHSLVAVNLADGAIRPLVARTRDETSDDVSSSVSLLHLGADRTTLYVLFTGEREYELAATNGVDGRWQTIARGERPAGKEVEPVWSADGRFLYLIWHDCLPNNDCYVKFNFQVTVVHPATGLSQSLLQTNDPDERLIRYILTPDGQTLYLGLSNRLLALPASGGAPQTLLNYNDERQGYKDFALSPDGQRIVYLQRMEACKGRKDIEGNIITAECRHEFFVMNGDGRQKKQLTSGFIYNRNVYQFTWWQPAQQPFLLINQ